MRSILLLVMRNKEGAIDLLEHQAPADVRLRPADRQLLSVSGIGQMVGLPTLLETGPVAVFAQACLTDVHPHDLRRTFGSWLVQAGVGIERVSELLRHHDVAITARVYAHLRQRDLAEAAAVLDGRGPGIAHGLAHCGEEVTGGMQYTTATN